jgi:hypothetical protein
MNYTSTEMDLLFYQRGESFIYGSFKKAFDNCIIQHQNLGLSVNNIRKGSRRRQSWLIALSRQLPGGISVIIVCLQVEIRT